MKKFLFKFFFFSLVIFSTCPFWLKMGIIIPVGLEVDQSIDLVNELTPNSIKTVKIGDSVGKNLNPNQQNVSGLLNICCNQAISPLGHMLLLKKALAAQNMDEIEVFGYFRPSSLLNSNLDQEWTNNYFIKKFYNENFLFNQSLISKVMAEEIDSIFLSRYKPWSALYRFSLVNKFSPLVIKYLGNNAAEPTPVSLIEYLLNTDFKNYIDMINFQPIPVHPENFETEQLAAFKLRELGINMKNPVMIADTFFVDDKIHIKKEHVSTVAKMIEAK